MKASARQLFLIRREWENNGRNYSMVVGALDRWQMLAKIWELHNTAKLEYPDTESGRAAEEFIKQLQERRNGKK